MFSSLGIISKLINIPLVIAEKVAQIYHPSPDKPLKHMEKTMKNPFDFLSKFPRPSKKTVLLILVVAAVTLLLSALISTWLTKVNNLNIPSVGNVMTLGVEAYWDENCKNKTKQVNWGTIWLGSSKNVTFYLRSVSNVDAQLNLNTTKWNPANVSDYLNLSWNYNGTPINPHQVVQVTLTLSASSSYSFMEYLITNNVKEFSFDINIDARTEEY
jgi:hypothetical protein